MLINDSEAVWATPFTQSATIEDGAVVIGVAGQHHAFDTLLSTHHIDVSNVAGRWEAFQIQVVQSGDKNNLFVIGSDPRGAAYGVLELSRLIGVSPWIWWADAVPETKTNVVLPATFNDIQRSEEHTSELKSLMRTSYA